MSVDTVSIDAENRRLVLALCHEVSNLLAGVRFHTAALDPVAKGAAAVAGPIDRAASHAGALTALVRPLLTPRVPGDGCVPRSVLESLRSGLDAATAERVAIRLDGADALPGVFLQGDPLRALLLSQILAGLAEAPEARVEVRAEREAGAVVFVVESDPPLVWPLGSASDVQGLAGRRLVRAVADALLGPSAVVWGPAGQTRFRAPSSEA